MSGSIEDLGAKIFGTLLAWGLVIYGVCWVIKWLFSKIVENAAPLIGVGLLVLLIAVLVGIGKRSKAKKEAVARWEQSELAPLLANLDAMSKLNRTEALLRRLPDALDAAERRIPQIERRAAGAKANGDSLDFHFT